MLPEKFPRRCALCKSTTNYLHSFPKDASRKQEWAEAIGLKIENIHSRDKLCDLHFSSDQYISEASKRLKDDALPSLLKSSMLESNVENKGVPTKRCRCVLCKKTVDNLHSFPKDASRKRKWAEAIGLKIENIHSRDKLCDLHFSSDQYISEASKRLKDDASPSLLKSSMLESNVENKGVPTKRCRCVLCKKTVDNLHSFPKDASRKRKWAEAIGLKIENIHSRDKLCDLHFSSDQYINEASKRLKDDASPLLLNATEVESVTSNANESNNLSEVETVAPNSRIALKDATSPSFFTCAITEVESLAKTANEGNGDSEIESDVNLQIQDQANSTANGSNGGPEIESDVNLQIQDQANSNCGGEEGPHVSTPTSSRARANSEVSQAFTPTRRYFRYYGDIKEDDVVTPRRAVIALKMGQEVVSKQREQLKAARKKKLGAGE